MKPAPKPLGLYIHIPFCKHKCAYCDFYSLSGHEGRMDDYTDALCAHLTEIAPFAAGHQVDTVYFGGGTPSYLGTKRLIKLLKTVQKKYRLDKQAEITLEANPDSAGDWKELRALRRAGFNRLSLGMQSASDAELQTIGRVHTWEQVGAAVEAARKAKFENLSLDLIYGLPRQTMEQWQANLTAAVDLAPEHLSCYGLKVEEGTPLFAVRDTAGLPGDEEQADMYLWTVEFLAQMGYAQYEISNFAKPGRESRHNLKYWTLQEYVGFGPGAHSDFGGVRYAYGRDLEGYIRGVQTHASMLSESESIPPLDRDTEWLMLGLRTVQGLDPKVFERRFRRRFDCFRPFLEECRTAGYAVEEEGRWHLTPKGFLVSNQIIGGMLDALAAEKRRRAEATARGDFRVDLGNPGKA
ncbi:MAG: radical SAM family heme chaperone HemW [Dysosmobacter sp.]|uniref:radical SAM family heme chaperone HemW n=1 Tax=Dysosmobacter sp. TaxID=2591382 RepID=UPI00283B5AE9|nr:radical SAM family heme chaperone HemW [Dysosmobacter sp.]MDR3984131.1 radical SAM family heme chaperone HemW [Dysosmobacter sp.]